MADSLLKRFTNRILRRGEFGVVYDEQYDKNLKKKDNIMTYSLSTKATQQKWNQFGQVTRDLKHRWELWNLSMLNGPAATVIDCYSQSIWTNGWKIEGDDPDLADMVTQRINDMRAANALKIMVEDGFRFGYGIAEKGEITGTDDWTVVPRCARDWDLIIDKIGNLEALRQYDDKGKTLLDLDPEIAIVLMPIVTSEGFGRSLLDQCYDPLVWWYKICQSSADSIYRHGYPVWDIQVSGPDGKLAPMDVMTGLEGYTTDLNSKAELVTNILTQVKELNGQGVPHVADYMEFALQSICASSSIPDELFGLGGGKTGLLAQSKWMIFYDKIAGVQASLSPQIDDQLVDPIAEDLGGGPGDCHWSFANPNTQNDIQKAQYCQQLLAINQLDPIVTNDWIRDYLGIKIPQPQTPQVGDIDPAITS